MPDWTDGNSRPVAIVTGGGKGLGRHIALRLANIGYHVAVLGRDRGALDRVACEIHEQGGSAQSFECDIAIANEVSGVVEELEQDGRVVDVAVCNAGIAGPVALCEDIPIDEWLKTLAVNLTGPFFLCRAVVPGMKRVRAGAIVLIGSTTGKRPVATRTPYAATKMGLIGFGRSLAAEVGSFGICVNTICPGVVEGDRWTRVASAFAVEEGVSVDEINGRYRGQTLLRRFVPPAAVSSLVEFFVSPAGRVLTAQDVNVCAGLVAG